MTWTLVNRAHAASRAIADRHYNRQSVGAVQFVPPGRCVVLLSELETALWVTSWQFPQFVKHAWPDAWVNSLFRRERNGDDGFAGIEDDHAASDLIRSAVAATRAIWSPPTEGLVTFVDPTNVQPIRRRRHACDCNCGRPTSHRRLLLREGRIRTRWFHGGRPVGVADAPRSHARARGSSASAGASRMGGCVNRVQFHDIAVRGRRSPSPLSGAGREGEGTRSRSALKGRERGAKYVSAGVSAGSGL